MSNDKESLLEQAIETPDSTYGLKRYEYKITKTVLNLLFNARKTVNTLLKTIDERRIKRIVTQLKNRIDLLIDRAREDEIRIHPSKTNEAIKSTYKNAIIYDLIIFSKSYDFIEKLEEIENNLLFCDFQELKPKFRELLERMGVIDDLFIDRLQVITSNITSEETAAKLMHKFSEELATAEKVGALEGILKIEKPKIFGRKDYYAKLSNILLNLIAKIGENKKDKPIPLRQLESHFRDDYPYIEATSKDLIKACEEMNNYGLLFLERDSQGLIWIRLTPPESKANIILEIAKKEGIVTLENLILETGWSQATIQEELNKFIKAGCVVVDSSYAQGTKYYFPGLYEKNDSNE